MLGVKTGILSQSAAVGDELLAYNPYNIWKPEDSQTVGSITTLNDFNNVGATYDMANTAASDQPTIAADSDFNDLDVLTFDGSDILINNVADYRLGDTSGLVAAVINPNVLGATKPIFSLGNTSISNTIFSVRAQGTDLQLILLGGTGGTNIIEASTPLIGNTTYAICVASTGSGYKFWVNGSLDGTSVITGSDNGSWLSRYSAMSNISLGANIYSSSFFSNIRMGLVGYFPYTNDTDALAINQLLITRYGL